MIGFSRFFLQGLHRIVDPHYLCILFLFLCSIGLWAPQLFSEETHIVLHSFISSASLGQFIHLAILYPLLAFAGLKTAAETNRDNSNPETPVFSTSLARRLLKLFAVIAIVATGTYFITSIIQKDRPWHSEAGAIFALVFYFEILFRTSDQTPVRAILRDMTAAGIAGSTACVVALVEGASTPGSTAPIFSYSSGLFLFGTKLLYLIYRQQETHTQNSQ